MQIVSIIFIIFIIVVWACSGFAVVDRWARNNVPLNIISILIFVCPVINTLLAIYYAYPTCKETLSKIFKNN